MTAEKSISPGRELNKDTFEKIFREYFPPLISFALKILEDEDDAREVVQQVFINLWERRQKIDLSAPLKPYLFTSVHHRSLNVIRDRKKFASQDMPETAGEWGVDTQIEAMELEAKIKEAIALLPDRCKVIFELNRFGGLKYAEIATQLDISVKTVENQMSKALKILRDNLLKYLTILLWLLIFTLN